MGRVEAKAFVVTGAESGIGQAISVLQGKYENSTEQLSKWR
jgi:NADP-dependent 3-hydroxy acid dehydrogenase YdfG